MDIPRLKEHIQQYKKKIEDHRSTYDADTSDRQARRKYYSEWTKKKLHKMSREEFEEYISKLWAMLIWGNKKYVTDKLISDHEFETVKMELAALVWGDNPLEKRWDRFRANIKGMGPAMMSEILSHVYPNDCMLWNRRAYVGLNYLGVQNLPRYNYQLTGKRYCELSKLTKTIVGELVTAGFKEADLLTADYFIWEELQVESNLSSVFRPGTVAAPKVAVEAVDAESAAFIHDEVRDKLKDIGQWLGLESRTEVRVADGSRVDTLWEQTIGNMGRVVYVFEFRPEGQSIA